jgi:hypothetical protein
MSDLMRALGKAQSEIPVLPMDGFNPYYSSRYTTLGKMLEVITPIIEKHGLVVAQHAVGGEGEVGVETVVSYPDSAESMSSVIKVPISGNNLGQESGKTISYLRRYALGALFLIYSDEDIDANTAEQQKKQSPQKATKQPMPKDVAELVDKYWTPLARQAEEYGIEFEPLPPNPSEKEVEQSYLALQKALEEHK